MAGKFQNTEELEKAYNELQSKLGERNGVQEEGLQQQGNDQEEVESDSDIGFLDELWNQSQQDDYDDEFLTRLSEYDSADIAQMFLDYKEQNEQGSELSEQDVGVLTNIAGGQDGYKQMIGWASENLSEQEIGMYDAVMAKEILLHASLQCKHLIHVTKMQQVLMVNSSLDMILNHLSKVLEAKLNWFVQLGIPLRN